VVVRIVEHVRSIFGPECAVTVIPDPGDGMVRVEFTGMSVLPGDARTTLRLQLCRRLARGLGGAIASGSDGRITLRLRTAPSGRTLIP
jgi:hypothetical protein